MAAKLIRLPGAKPADEGEVTVVRYLENVLPGTYTLLPNIELAQPGSPPYEYDIVVIAPHALYVVEVKRWRGGIRGDDYTWVIAGKHARPNPFLTTNNKARVLKSLIKRLLPTVADQIWVEAVVVIADDQGAFDIRGQYRDRVFRYTDLPTFLTNASLLGGHARDIRAQRGYLEVDLQRVAHARPTGPLRYGDHEVKETLNRRDDVAEFLAVNTLLRDPQPVRLRVFTYDPYLPPEVLDQRREAIRREADALEHIGANPNLIAIKGIQSDPNDPNLLIEVTDWSDEGTLRDQMNGETPLALERKLELAEGIALGLQAAHEASVIHRDVRPENILIGRDGQPRLMNFDRARLTMPGAMSIGDQPRDPSVPRIYLAPELALPAHNQPVGPAADIYGLGMLLYELLAGATPFNSPEDAIKLKTASGGPKDYGATNLPAALNDLVRRMVKADPLQRPSSAREVAEVLRAVRQKPSGTVEDGSVQIAPIQPEPDNFQAATSDDEPLTFRVGETIDGKYLVQKVLASGGSGQAYKVYDSIFDRVFALKVFRASDLSSDWLQREVKTLSHITHPHIVQVHGWGRLARTGRLYLVSEFIEGEELTQFTTPSRRLPIREAVQIAVDLLDALEALHPKTELIRALEEKGRSGDMTGDEFAELTKLKQEGILHRDIKPSNLILAADGVKLLDFNIAKPAIEVSNTYVGTPGYMLPGVGIEPWQTDGDLFATGIVLYQLVTGHSPYEGASNEMISADSQPTDPRKYVPELTARFSDLLMHATSVYPDVRYKGARRFRMDLEALHDVYMQALPLSVGPLKLTLDQYEDEKHNYNPFVTRLLRLYSQARRDNSGTRGLDEIARLTYVQTRLDKYLGPAVLDARYRLVIITGNAGDGKTAFIQSLERQVEQNGTKLINQSLNSKSFTYKGADFLTNYDGSQDEGETRVNDKVLTEFFEPFNDASIDALSYSSAKKTFTRLIAINEGRLVDFFSEAAVHSSGHNGQEMVISPFRKLGGILTDFFAMESPILPAWLLVVDLNRRSVVAQDPEANGQSIFDRQLQALLQPQMWAPCEVCALKSQCFIKFNADTLSDPALGAQVRERLRTLFEITHLHRQLHITMRDLRSALSWLIFRDHNCDDVAQMLQVGIQPEASLQLLYANAFASDDVPVGGRKDDRLVSLLRQIDPAEVSNPVVDRPLHFRGLDSLRHATFEKRSAEPMSNLERWETPTGYAVQQSGVMAAHRAKHGILRRFAYFERRDEGWAAMLPYRELDGFHSATSPNANHNDLRKLIIRAISYAEGARDEKLASQYLCLRASNLTNAHVPVKSFRLFPADDFTIEVHGLQSECDARFIERTPDRILMIYTPSDMRMVQPGIAHAELPVSLDLLELLAQVGKGFRPSPDDVSGFFMNLVVFKNALARMPYRRALLTRDDHTYYELVQTDTATVALRLWETA